MTEPVTLESLRPIIGVIARERTREDPSNYDDAVQEGMINAWRAITSRPDAPRPYALVAAKNGIRGHVSGRATYGKPSSRGRRMVEPTFIEDMSTVDVNFDDPWQAVDTAMDVHAAMQKWSDEQRKLAFLVFYQGMTLEEASAWMGKPLTWGWREMQSLRAGDHRTNKERKSRKP